MTEWSILLSATRRRRTAASSALIDTVHGSGSFGRDYVPRRRYPLASRQDVPVYERDAEYESDGLAVQGDACRARDYADMGQATGLGTGQDGGQWPHTQA
jgi:hypothetical protein